MSIAPFPIALTPIEAAILERLHRGCTDVELMASFHVRRSTLYQRLYLMRKKIGPLPNRRNKWAQQLPEGPETSAARIAKDVAGGIRCTRCHLLLPHFNVPCADG